jgi:hypothetical protein
MRIKSGDTHNKDSLRSSPAKFIGAAKIRGSESSVCSAIRELVQIEAKKAESHCERDDEHAPHVRRVRKNGPIFSANSPHIVAYEPSTAQASSSKLMLRCVELLENAGRSRRFRRAS